MGVAFTLANLLSQTDYSQAIDVVRRLKTDLFRLADQKGNLDPEVIALSQRIDQYIVLMQRYLERQAYRVS